MSVRSREEIMNKLNEIFGDNNSDDVLEIMTDISDTIGNDNAKRITELETQLAEQDANWRKRYRDAFMSGADEEIVEEEPPKARTFDDLFTRKN